jgi:predicted membrane channel-forming protein YqfA (hemolysin III family)
MSQDTILYTLPQWFIFGAIIGIAYGWVEQKKVFRAVGLSLYILLGMFAAYTIYSGMFSASEFLTPEEIMSEELDENIISEIPFEAKLLPAYWSFIVSGILAIPGIYFDWKERKPKRLFMLLSGLVSLFGFFIIVGELRAI